MRWWCWTSVRLCVSLRGIAVRSRSPDDNALSTLALPGGAQLKSLRVLRASNNRLQALELGAFPGLRTLYADGNMLAGLGHGRGASRIENLSLRNQSVRGSCVSRFSLWVWLVLIQSRSSLLTRDVRDAKRVYLSGETNFAQRTAYYKR